MNGIKYGWPGAGAIEYARRQVSGLSREQAALIMRNLLTGTSSEKRVKRCAYCGYRWRDESLRNTLRTCSDECKTAAKTLQKRQQRADKALLSGKTKKKTKKAENYIWWLEYPFWLNEYEMLKNAWKHEVSKDAEFLDYIQVQNEIYGPGNRRVRGEEEV
jgi:hypothetical protein